MIAPTPTNVSNSPLSLTWKGSAVVLPTDLMFESNATGAATSEIVYEVILLREGSVLKRNGMPILPGLETYSFTQKDIERKYITLAHDGLTVTDEVGFEFSVTFGNSLHSLQMVLVQPPGERNKSNYYDSVIRRCV
eukprot:scaffold117136_cov53-Prasinocladus_malaysianus.AAC.1